MGERVTLRAYAKVNLCLSVGAPITDGEHAGMHPIASWMAAVDLFDEVEVEPADVASVDVRWHDGRAVEWDTADDLAARAARLVETRPHRVGVRKRIPAGGGLGGGSSDAAAVLLAVNELAGSPRTRAELRAISASLGSDIAFFVHDGALGDPPPPALVTGLGDGIERTPAIDGEVTLICPPFGCPTGAVYRTFDEIHPGAAVRAEAVAAAARSGRLADELLFNDLGLAACRVRPELDDVRGRVERAVGRPVHVSGSGSTLFVLGRVAEGVIESVCPGERVVHTRFC